MYIVLVKAAVVEKILVVLNKIDDPAIGRGKVRLEEFKDKRTPCVGPGDRVMPSVCAWWGCDR